MTRAENTFTNLDARYLAELADDIDRGMERWSDADRLRLIAMHLQSFDDKAMKHLDGTFEAGVGFAAKAQVARSNLLRSPGRRVTNDDGETIIAAFIQDGNEIKKGKPGAKTPPKAKNVGIVDVAKQPAARKGFRLQDL